MEEDKTIFLGANPVTVKVIRGHTDQRMKTFTGTFRIGRSEECDLKFDDKEASRIHVEVALKGTQWVVRDLNSTNGTYFNGIKINQKELVENAELELGRGGPLISLNFLNPEKQKETSGKQTILSGQKDSSSITRFLEHLKKEDIGQHTMFIRRALERVKKKQRKRYYIVISSIAVLLLFTGILALIQRAKINRMLGLAEDIFYSMKSTDLQIANLLASDRDLQEELEVLKNEHIEMEKK